MNEEDYIKMEDRLWRQYGEIVFKCLPTLEWIDASELIKTCAIHYNKIKTPEMNYYFTNFEFWNGIHFLRRARLVKYRINK